MNPQQYDKYQALQRALFDYVDSFLPIETEAGNLLFQRIGDALLELYEKVNAEAADPSH